jgi:hypothetical protein
MKINFKVTLKDLDGNDELAPNGELIYLHKTFASMLAKDPHNETGINYVDAMSWAIAINKGEDVDLEKSEQEAFKTFIEKSNFFASAKLALKEAMTPKPEAQSNGKEVKQTGA